MASRFSARCRASWGCVGSRKDPARTSVADGVRAASWARCAERGWTDVGPTREIGATVAMSYST